MYLLAHWNGNSHLVPWLSETEPRIPMMELDRLGGGESSDLGAR